MPPMLPTLRLARSAALALRALAAVAIVAAPALVLPMTTAEAAPKAKKPVAAFNAKKGLAVKGYDPVAYFTDGKPVEGSPAHEYVWEGATYRFASAEHLEMFKADPTKYAPQFGGYCAYAISRGDIADISPTSWAVEGGKLYLNNNSFAQFLWDQSRPKNITKGETNWTAYPKKPLTEAAPEQGQSQPQAPTSQ